MKVHVTWLPREHESVPPNMPLSACVAPDGETVLQVRLENGGGSYDAQGQLDPTTLLQRHLEAHAIPSEALRWIVGMLQAPPGQEASAPLLQRTLEVLVLAEEPPGNELPSPDMALPDETFDVICHGSCWPGYKRASLAPDGDVVADHVVMGSVIPPAAP